MKFVENGVEWNLLHPAMTPEHLGFIPEFLSVHDPRKAIEQINDNYQHGGGWRDFKGFTMLPDHSLSFEGDPPMRALAEAELHGETLRFHDCSWFSVTAPDGSYKIARLD